jgi:hypothetical protein
MLNNTFYHCTHLPLLDSKYITEASTGDYVGPSGPTSVQTIKTASTFQETEFCYNLLKEFGYVKSLYLRMPPHTVYDWHTDLERKCAINFLLTDDPDCLTLFREPIDNNRLLYNIKKCNYTLLQPTVFNTTISHCIINHSDNFRHLLTVTVGFKTNFEDVQNFLSNYQTTGY